jgi:hypothetical protein
MRFAYSCFLLAAAWTQAKPVIAQLPTPPAEKVEAIKKLNHWLGTWKGSGWAMMGAGQRSEFTITETVQSKVSGSALLIEGLGRAKSADGAEGPIAHEALAVVVFDTKSKRYRFRANDLRGQDIDTELKTVEGGYEWGFKVEGREVSVRFTIRIDEKRWLESGEVTLDNGKTWMKFLEMTLERQKGR